MRRVGKYALGRTIGVGTFAKVKFAINTDTGGFFAIKVLAKDTILRNKMVEQVRKLQKKKKRKKNCKKKFLVSSELRQFGARVNIPGFVIVCRSSVRFQL